MTSLGAVLAFPEDMEAATQLAGMLGAKAVPIARHTFPDQEVLLSFSEKLPGVCALYCTLDRPNPKYLPLLLAAQGARERGVLRLGLIAPYLPYMRQDTSFAPGQLISARVFASDLSHHFDWLVTLDPHLHRVHKLKEIFDIPCTVAHASGPIAKWISQNVSDPILIGPDSESAQWVSEIARRCAASYTTFSKNRRGDSDVTIARRDLLLAGKTSVLIDDIVSTATTMAAAVELIRSEARQRPHCIAVHGIFAPGAFERLQAAAPQSIVTTNTIRHPSNGIDILGVLVEATQSVL
jgi:ribose-phosphate pyrophosphokinase